MDKESNLPFSLDSDFEEIQDKDRTVELVGYVCSVQNAVEVGTKIKYNLLKFGLSNGAAKKVQCLIWGLELIELHQPNIVLNKIIHIDGAHSKYSRLPYALESQGYCPFEIIIQPSTVLTFLGSYEPLLSEVSVEEPVTEVTFETIIRANGKIAIDGFVKTKFTSIPSRFEKASYGCGSITDGQYKITIHISNFSPIDFHKGTPVKVVGEVNSDNPPLTITCKSSSCITKRDKVQPMTEAQLMRGTRTPKRLSS